VPLRPPTQLGQSDPHVRLPARFTPGRLAVIVLDIDVGPGQRSESVACHLARAAPISAMLTSSGGIVTDTSLALVDDTDREG
jgi:hypothetical protein